MTLPAADAMPVPMPPRLPTPSQLARLGTVLCLYRAGGELGGWSRAVHAEAGVAVHSEGPDECIAFRDPAGDCCWKLYLLPDSDFLAWERLSASLARRAGDDACGQGIGERLLRNLAGRLRNGQWQGSVLRLHALQVGPGMSSRDVLAASLAPVSPMGAAAARRIARSAGADAAALADDCCCLQAARAVAAGQHDDAYPLIRLHTTVPE